MSQWWSLLVTAWHRETVWILVTCSSAVHCEVPLYSQQCGRTVSIHACSAPSQTCTPGWAVLSALLMMCQPTLPVNLSTFICQHVAAFCLPSVSTCLPTYLSTYVCMHLSIYLPIFLPESMWSQIPFNCCNMEFLNYPQKFLMWYKLPHTHFHWPKQSANINFKNVFHITLSQMESNFWTIQGFRLLQQTMVSWVILLGWWLKGWP